MSAIKRRENTFRIDYANVPNRPSSEEVHHFVGATLGMKREEVLRIQYSRNTGIAFVKASSLEVAQQIVENNDDKHELTVDGKPYKLRLVMEDGAVAVRLFNLSEDVTNEKITKFLNTHGDILTIREELADENHFFAGLPTGVRIVRMTIKTSIPSYVTIDGETTFVSYNGQQQTCRYCCEFMHSGISCVLNKKLLVQKLATHSSSYADVTKHQNPPRQKTSRPNPRRTIANRPLSKSQPLPVRPDLGARNATQTQESAEMDAEQGSSAVVPSIYPEPVDAEFVDFTRPAGVLPGDDPSTWTRVTRKSASKKKDGNETDSSTSSRNSRKNASKKMRCDKSNNPHDQDQDPIL